ncbi:MAG TPA: hypothetical protein DD727_01620, partial [Clostridiales bacterium]|nr:hypothetical protein [Clostridiales bacterium]
MFKRRDGRHMKELDAFHEFYTYLMPKRVSASVWTQLTADAGRLAKYLEEKKGEGVNYTIFQVVVAALIRTASQYPQLNRFIYGHKIYARTEYVLSFAVSLEGQTIFRKIWLDPEDTLKDV